VLRRQGKIGSPDKTWVQTKYQRKLRDKPVSSRIGQSESNGVQGNSLAKGNGEFFGPSGEYLKRESRTLRSYALTTGAHNADALSPAVGHRASDWSDASWRDASSAAATMMSLD
jgi:hypothetical protein